MMNLLIDLILSISFQFFTAFYFTCTNQWERLKQFNKVNELVIGVLNISNQFILPIPI